MNYLSLGQFNIPIEWLAFIVALLFSDFRAKKQNAITIRTIELLIWVYILVWKLSYILFSWTDFLKEPISLLYFDGGIMGHLLAITSLLVICFRRRAHIEWIVLWHYWARFIAVYSFITLSFQFQWGFAAIWLILLLLIEFKYKPSFLLIQWLLLLWVGGWTDTLVHLHAFILLTYVYKTRELKVVATIGLLSLVAIMLTDTIEQVKQSTTTRVAIDLPTTTGEQYELATQEQSLTVVNFFATWCPPCKAEMPHLQKFAQDLPHDVALIGINLTARDNGPEKLATFIDEYKVTYPILLDHTDHVGEAFYVRSIPTTVLLDAHGNELTRIIGPISESKLRQLIKQYQE